MNAYHVIDHASSIVDIDFDRMNNHLYIADGNGLTLRQIDEAKLILHFIKKDLIGKEEKIVIFAESFDPHTNKTFKCQEEITAILVDPSNMTIFPSNYVHPTTYSVNYPKPLTIPLKDFALGPNVEYKLNNKEGTIPTYWFNKLNKT